jgi:hypothetical protein
MRYTINMDASTDQAYISYCKDVLKSVEIEYEKADKINRRHHKVMRVCFPLICFTLICLSYLLFLVIAYGSTPDIRHLTIGMVVLVMVGAFPPCVMELRYPSQKDIVDDYESHPSCADKIVFYAYSYEDWLGREKLAEAERKKQEKIQADSQRICAAINVPA